MNTTRHLPVRIRQLIISLAIVSIVLLAPAWALATSGVAVAAPKGTAQPSPGPRGGPNYWSITGARVGAPSPELRLGSRQDRLPVPLSIGTQVAFTSGGGALRQGRHRASAGLHSNNNRRQTAGAQRGDPPMVGGVTARC